MFFSIVFFLFVSCPLMISPKAEHLICREYRIDHFLIVLGAGMLLISLLVTLADTRYG
jgi:hypothetical protein